MSVLIFSPHTDDAELGCGATIKKLQKLPWKIQIVVMSRCEAALPPEYPRDTLVREFEDAMFVLEHDDWCILDHPKPLMPDVSHIPYINLLRDSIYRIWNYFDPVRVYTPHTGCVHQDHRAVTDCVIQVGWRRRASIFGYYLPNDNRSFSPDWLEVVDWDTHVIKKLAALECYKSQRDLRSWWGQGVFQAALQHYAPHAGAKFVEPFEVIKVVSR